LPTKSPAKGSTRALGSNDVAPSRALEEDPESLLNKTSTVLDEQEALRALTYDTVNLEELEARIGLASRIILEHYLRCTKLAAKDKCDIALRAITTLEGSKQEVVWRDKMMKKPSRVGLDALKKEKEKVAAKLLKAALRKKEIQVSHAEAALKEMGEKETAVEEQN